MRTFGLIARAVSRLPGSADFRGGSGAALGWMLAVLLVAAPSSAQMYTPPSSASGGTSNASASWPWSNAAGYVPGSGGATLPSYGPLGGPVGMSSLGGSGTWPNGPGQAPLGTPPALMTQPAVSAQGASATRGTSAGTMGSPASPFGSTGTVTGMFPNPTNASAPATGAMPVNPYDTGGRSPSAPGATANLSSSKPFAGYHAPAAVSPYMGMYQRPVRGVDNYNYYVRPQLDQQALNRQTQSQLQSLRSNQAQGATGMPTPPGQQGQAPQAGTPASYYMNYHQYYPNGGR